MSGAPVLLQADPSIERDGTRRSATGYVDGQWVRFYRGRPRKMGGYFALTEDLPGISRGMSAFVRGDDTYLHVGTADTLRRAIFDNTGALSSFLDRTPLGVPDPRNLWQFATIFDRVTSVQRLLAFPGKNLEALASSAPANLYLGGLTDQTPLTVSTAPPVSGGVMVLHPYAVLYGDTAAGTGYVAWSVAGNPDSWTATGSGDAYIADQKIINGLPSRGTNTGPAGLLWSLDALIRMSFVGGSAIWAFDTVSTSVTSMSSRAHVEFDGIYYWVGVDRFYLYNGTVRELPNETNADWFFDNINLAQRQKVFAFKNPRWGEIWWCYPRGTATECTHAVIFNTRTGKWYDTALPDSGRFDVANATLLSNPVLAGSSVIDGTTRFELWRHEFGSDKVRFSNVLPIRSYFETPDLTLQETQEPTNKAIRTDMIEPDFLQSGEMTVTITGNANARSQDVDSVSKPFPQTPSRPEEQVVGGGEVRRQVRYRFESNTLAGDYQMGKTFVHVIPADERVTQ